MAFNLHLHYEYFKSAIPNYNLRCWRCGGGPVMLSLHAFDRCLNCRSYVVAEPIIRLRDLWARFVNSTAKCVSSIRGMPNTQILPV